MSSAGFFLSYGANKVAGEQEAHKGFQFKTSKALIENVIQKQELTLLSETAGIATVKPEVSYVNSKGKPIDLTPFQMKLITAFAQIVDTQLDKEEVKNYIEELTPDKIQKRIENDLRGLKGRISCVVDIPLLTKIVYSKKRVGGKQTNKVREEIINLSQVRQQYRLSDHNGGTLTLRTPLIHLGKEIEYRTGDKVVRLNKAEIIFEDIFVYDITDKYTVAPISLLSLWNETGVNTGLFAMLLFLLQEVRGNYIKHAFAAADEHRKKLNKQKLSREDLELEVAEYKRNGLTYKESFASLCERLNKDTYYQTKRGKSYLRYEKAREDLQQAQEALRQMGIISEYYESKSKDGEIMCNFVFNPDWIPDETKRLQGLLPPGEVGEVKIIEDDPIFE